MNGSNNLQKESGADLIWLEIPLKKGLGISETVERTLPEVNIIDKGKISPNKEFKVVQFDKKTENSKGKSKKENLYSVTDQVQKSHIKIAMNCNWALRDKDIKVAVVENIVTLTGSVNSWYQLEQAERISWKAPGVLAVNNHLVVEYNY